MQEAEFKVYCLRNLKISIFLELHIYLLFPHGIIWAFLRLMFSKRFAKATVKLGNIQQCVHTEQCVYLLWEIKK